MGRVFVIEDLFLGGLGVEIVGAYLVARGLLDDAPSIARRATTRGFNAPQAVSEAEDRIDASQGLAYIGFGVLVQVTGFLLLFGFGSTEVERPLGVLGGAICVLVGALACAVALHKLTRQRRVKRLLVAIARFELYGDKMLEHPQAQLLRWLGETLGEAARGREPDEDYCRRVFGVDEFHHAARPTPVASGAIAPQIGQPMSDDAITAALNREFRRRGGV